MTMLQTTLRATLPFSPSGRKGSVKRATVICVAHAQRPLQVAVTGAGGRTGALVMKKLLEKRSEFSARGVVRSEKSANKLKELGASGEQIFIGDILDPTGSDLLDKAVAGCDALIIATSAVPKIQPLSLIKVVWGKITKADPAPRPEFTFKANQSPEQIDWMGQKLQIDAAKKAGVKKIVVVSSMGGTQPDNFLNTIGNGNILLWKRKAEKYLIDSGVNYTIIHPGGLIDEKGGQRELVIDVDDKLIKEGVKYRSIPREDVAELCVQSLMVAQADNRSIDVVSKPPEAGAPTADFQKLFSDMAANCDYSDMPKVEQLLAKA